MSMIFASESGHARPSRRTSVASICQLSRTDVSRTVSAPFPYGERSAAAISASICASGTGNDSSPAPSTMTRGMGVKMRPPTQ